MFISFYSFRFGDQQQQEEEEDKEEEDHLTPQVDGAVGVDRAVGVGGGIDATGIGCCIGGGVDTASVGCGIGRGSYIGRGSAVG